MWAAIEVCKKLPEGKRVVVVLPDSIRNYMTKFINDDWMYECGFISEDECRSSYKPKLIPNLKWGQDYAIKDLHLKEAFMLNQTTTVADAIDSMQGHSFD